MRKEPLKMKMEDIKIEFVDVCVVPTADAYDIFEFDSDSGHGSPSSLSVPMEVSIAQAGSPDGSTSGCSSSETGNNGGGGGGKPRKRAKLDHMSPEEKAQHRKMMNRISAQSARDRQKALMIRQDSAIKNLEATNDDLKKKNLELTVKNEDLTGENQTLKDKNQRLSTLVTELESKLKTQQQANENEGPIFNEDQFQKELKGILQLKEENEGNVRCGSPSEPAVLRTIPLQKGSLEPLRTLSLLLVLWMSSYLGNLRGKQGNNKLCMMPAFKDFQKQIFTANRCQTLINLITPLQKQLLHKWLIRHGIPWLSQWTPG